MTNSFIVTGQGFIQNITFNFETKEYDILYTDKLRYARPFSTSTAKSYIEKHNLLGFIYRPYEQEPIRGKYIVSKRPSYSFLMEGHMIDEYYPEKASMVYKSDVVFLQNKGEDKRNLLTFEEAKAEAIKKNKEMLAELNSKIQKLEAMEA